MSNAQPKQPTGNFAAFFNRNKTNGDNLPMFVDGKISKPGADDERTVTLWAFEYRDAEGVVHTGFNGTVGNMNRNAPAIDQVQALMATRKQQTDLEAGGELKVAPNQIVIFTNKTKAEAADKARPTHYGFVNFGDSTPLVRVSAWLDKDRYQRPILTGATQFPMPKAKDAADTVKRVAPPPPEATKVSKTERQGR
ncbi:MAG: hypothetical protein ABL901_00820 [Hyphomicrobiaceae bacterium]